MKHKKRLWAYSLGFIGFIVASQAIASEEVTAEAGHAGTVALTFLWIAVILFFAKIGGLVEKIGQPAVLGELVIGVLLGNLALIGIHTFDPILENAIIKFLAELGVVILLLQIGLESNIGEMKKVGLPAFIVAVVGVVLPFILGTYVVGPWLMPGLDMNAYLFLGASLTATSVGITARVFKDLGKLQTPEAQIVLGAAVIDDVLGLIILAVVSAIVTIGAVSAGMIGWILAKAILFLVGSIILGQFIAPMLGKFFAKIQTGIGMKFTLIIIFGLVLAYMAQLIGLAPIVGAFAAGLILDPVHFRYFKDPKIVADVKQVLKNSETNDETAKAINSAIESHSRRHIEDLIEPVAFLLVPIFFVLTGMEVSLEALFNVPILLVALAITAVAIIGKLLAGYSIRGVNRNIVGFGMVPRGEVGLIFAAIGKGLGVISEEMFSVIVIMVILTTLVAPPVLNWLIKRQK
ncbi:MAG: cation:proton antiporter [Candidatus Uhrbacteria bacterium]|nr:cation:proton antiporter [Candidatus Uhrbacteria bacterium]